MRESELQQRLACLSIEQLLTQVQNEITRYQHQQPTAYRYTYELFRRAIVERNQQAWSGLYQQYQALVCAWMRHASRGLVDDDLASSCNLAFAKFARNVPAHKFAAFPSVRSLLAYLKDCTCSVVIDEWRARQRVQCEETMESAQMEALAGEVHAADPADIVADRLAAQELWQLINTQLASLEERLAFQCLFGSKPAELHQQHPDVFPTVQDVYRVKRNLLARLQHNRALRAYLRERSEAIWSESRESR